MTPILSVRDLEKKFGSVVAARDITVDVPPQQTVGIIGANGAGKTTFVNMITGHLHPTKGRIAFEGRDITGLPSRAITRLGISRSFQVAQIFSSLTALDNLCAAAAIARGSNGVLGRAITPLRSPQTLVSTVFTRAVPVGAPSSLPLERSTTRSVKRVFAGEVSVTRNVPSSGVAIRNPRPVALRVNEDVSVVVVGPRHGFVTSWATASSVAWSG